MVLPPLTVVDTDTVLALLRSSPRSGAARILRVLGLVARAAELDARRVVRAVARLSDSDAAEGAESENSYYQDLHQR
jgi:hypothetical protein